MQPSTEQRKDDHSKLCRTQSSVPNFMWPRGGASGVQSQGWRPPPPPPPFDRSMPPPPPRTPWELEAPASGSPQAGGSTAAQNQHKKLSRQISLNPNYDPRIHGNMPPLPPPMGSLPPPPPPPHPGTADFSYPPPPVMHPGPGGGAGGPHHMAVTRNSSAPEDQQLYNQLLQHKQQHQQQRQQLAQQQQPPLHKTLSDGLMDWPQPSPLLSGNSIWENEATSNAGTSLGPVGSAPPRSKPGAGLEARSKLYYHLAKLFPEDQVRNALTALPDETDPHKICSYILFYNGTNKS